MFLVSFDSKVKEKFIVDYNNNKIDTVLKMLMGEDRG
jgi:hypothetical protein